MMWLASLLVCAWGFLFEAGNSKVGLRLRGVFRFFENGFISIA